jgi:hypothetical protein
MSRKLYALSGVFLIALVIAGLWASKAGGFTDQDPVDPFRNWKLNGVSMADMTRGADRIIIGKCTETRSEWTNNGRSLVTRATVLVTDTVKGVETESVRVEMLGGRASKGKFQLAMTYPGAATMGPGDEMALFLVPTNEAANIYTVMDGGKFSIVKDTAGVEVLANVPMKVRAPRATGVTSGTSEFVRLSEFKAMVEESLK